MTDGANINLTSRQIATFQAEFSRLDTDKDGKLTAADLFADDPTGPGLFKPADSDADGYVDFQEYLAMVTQNMDLSGDVKVREAFEEFDKDEDGLIGAEELKQVMKTLGEELSSEEAAEMVRASDIDGDEQINYEEFEKLLSVHSDS
ncbi:EF-hand domain-containing protein [Streptomyces sp. 4.24]|uniref:EF-hand domain-containing protein n=1 Tax=Streptomyces tritrimontium TaxID=3406573 RepID=UPI003BB5C704